MGAAAGRGEGAGQREDNHTLSFHDIFCLYILPVEGIVAANFLIADAALESDLPSHNPGQCAKHHRHSTCAQPNPLDTWRTMEPPQTCGEHEHLLAAGVGVLRVLGTPPHVSKWENGGRHLERWHE